MNVHRVQKLLFTSSLYVFQGSAFQRAWFTFVVVVFQDELHSGECKGEGLFLEELEEEWVLEVCVLLFQFDLERSHSIGLLFNNELKDYFLIFWVILFIIFAVAVVNYWL